GHDIPRRGAQAVDGSDNGFQFRTFRPDEHAGPLFSDVYVGLGRDYSLPGRIETALGLGHVKSFGNGDREIPMTERCLMDPYALANHQGTGPAVEHHAGTLAAFLDVNVFQHGHEDYP